MQPATVLLMLVMRCWVLLGYYLYLLVLLANMNKNCHKNAIRRRDSLATRDFAERSLQKDHFPGLEMRELRKRYCRAARSFPR